MKTIERSKVLSKLKGYIGVESMQSSSYKGREVANQTIVKFDNGILFQSYNSIIAVKISDKIYLGEDWDYSRTTGKYRNQFLNESKKETLEKLDTGGYTLMICKK